MLFKRVICFLMGLLILSSNKSFSVSKTTNSQEFSFKNATSELRHYHLKMLETHFFLYTTFYHMKLQIRDVQEGWIDETEASSSLKKISRKRGVVLLIEELEKSFKKIYSKLKKVYYQSANFQLKGEEFDKNSISELLKSMTDLMPNFQSIFLAKNLIDNYYHQNRNELEELFEETKNDIKRENIKTYIITKEHQTRLFEQTCLNLDNAIITATHSLTKTKILADQILLSLKKRSKLHRYFKSYINIFENDLQRINTATGCFTLYYEILQYITTLKIERVHKFICDKDYKKRKNYLNSRLRFSIAEDNHFDPKKEHDLIQYFKQKSKLAEIEGQLDKSKLYSRFARQINWCQPQRKVWI